MDKRDFLKRYLKIVLILFVALFALSALIIFGISSTQLSSVNWSTAQRLWLAVGCAYLPCASFCGFCTCFARVKEFNKAGKVMICVLFPITLALITVAGIISLIPSIFYSVYILITKK